MLQNSNITRKEWLTATIIIFLTCIIIVAPYLYGYAITPKDKYFTGVHFINSADTYTYLSWIEQARQNQWLFKNLYSPETQPNLIFHPLFLLLGSIGRILPISNIIIYHAARVVLTIIFLYFVYFFLSIFFDQKKYRLIAFLLLITSSGLGFALGTYSTDLWVTESITFLSIYESVINVFSLILMLYIFTRFLLHSRDKNLSTIFLSALALNLLVLVHPLDFVLTTAIIAGYSLYALSLEKNGSVLYNFLYATLLSFPSILWQAYVLLKNPAISFWATQNLTIPSQPANFLLGYGLLLAFAWIGTTHILGQKQKKCNFLLIWILLAALLIFIPFNFKFQRKFSEGLHIPITLLATAGLGLWVGRISKHKRAVEIFLYSILIFYLSLTNIFIIYRDIKYFQTGAYPYYISQSEITAIKWLKTNTSTQSTVFSGPELGNLIPGISGRTVYFGYDDFTIEGGGKLDLLKNVLSNSNKNNDSFKSFLKQNNIDYVFFDKELQKLALERLQNMDYLLLQFENTDVKIYKVANLPL